MAQLDGLRAIAVLVVIWSHWSPKYNSLFGIHLGFYGVQMFFVLSGFLITGILFDAAGDAPSQNNGGLILKQFYIRRFLRIFPLYYAVLAMVILMNVAAFRTTWPWHAAYLSNVYFWLAGSRGDFGGHLWSLSVEEQFYLFWPVLMVFSSNRTRFAIICAAIAAAPTYREIFQIERVGKDPSLADGMMLAQLDSFGIGALLAYYQKFNPARTSAMASRAACFGLAGLGVIAISDQSGIFSLGVLKQTLWGFWFVWVIYYASIGYAGLFGKFLTFKPIRYIGKISYGLYLLHGFAYAICQWLIYSAPIPAYRVFARLNIPASIFENSPFTTLMMGSVTFGLAVISYHFFETPLNNLKRHFPYPRPDLPSI